MSTRNPALFGIVVNWNDIPAVQVRRGVRRRVFATDEVLMAHHELEVGMEPNPHTHDDFDQLVHISSGRCRYYVDATPHLMKAGDFLLVRRGQEHYVEPLEAPCVNVDFFVPPREDLASQAYVPSETHNPSGLR